MKLQGTRGTALNLISFACDIAQSAPQCQLQVRGLKIFISAGTTTPTLVLTKPSSRRLKPSMAFLPKLLPTLHSAKLFR